MGSLKLKVEPFPSSEFTQMVPPMAVTRPLQIESPNPVPGSNSFNCRNRSKIRDPAYNPAESFADIQIAEGAEPDFQGAKCGQR